MWIRGGLLVTAENSYSAEIGIRSGRIAEITSRPKDSAGQVLDATGCWILPGIIDVHTHMQLPQKEALSADDFFSGTRAAACGGVTTIIDFSLHRRNVTLEGALRRRLQEAQGRAAVDYGLHAEIFHPDQAILDEIPRLVDLGVTSFKVYLAYRQEGRMVDDGELYAVLKRAGQVGALVMVHAENGPVVEYLVDQFLADGHSAPIFHARSRPNQVEGEAVLRAMAISQMAGGFLYIVHLTTRQALAALRQARRDGLPVWAETCPQYLLLDEDVYLGQEGIQYIVTPPLRSSRDQTALWEGLARGDLSVVSTDHCPFTREQKRQGEKSFAEVPNGLPGVETSLSLMYSRGVDRGQISANQLVALMSTNPAKIFGLYPAKGSLEVGSDADLVVFDPQAEFEISVDRLHMNTDFSPYQGLTGRGVVKSTVLRGETIAQEGHFCGPPGCGRFVPRRKFEPEKCRFWDAEVSS